MTALLLRALADNSQALGGGTAHRMVKTKPFADRPPDEGSLSNKFVV